MESVMIKDGNLEIGAHVIWLDREQLHIAFCFSKKRPFFLYAVKFIIYISKSYRANNYNYNYEQP